MITHRRGERLVFLNRRRWRARLTILLALGVAIVAAALTCLQLFR